MTRDYRAKQNPRHRRPARTGGGTILGIFIGLVLGLGIAAAVFYYISRTPSPFQNATGQAKNTANGNGSAASPTAAADKPRFDFYKILPGAEEAKGGTERKSPEPKSAEPRAAETKTGKPVEGKPTDIKGSEQYFLQVGSYAQVGDAENERAKLALLGFEASIQAATLPDKGVRHRVRLGPYASAEEMNRNKAELGKRGVEATVIKNP
ncbi:hypothetical protein BURK2_02408 [Burkholderiales bacterium]|nr:hypothetical protein BURK2_02408 [Burkholderiales bacterium]